MSQLLVATLVAASISAVAWRLRALRPTGAVAATVVGSIVLGLGGLAAALVLVFFFATSSALSHLQGSGPRARRDARQVLANGSVAALAAALHGTWPHAYVAFLGALATAAGDTWATEIGVRWGGTPRSIVSLRSVSPGTSGAVSPIGTISGLAGTLAVALVGYALVGQLAADRILAVGAAGFLGTIGDSLLGATVQARYRCPDCATRPETARHAGCPRRARRLSGVPGMDNDAVNWLATLIGAAISVALVAWAG